MNAQILSICAIATLAALGLFAANLLRDHGADASVSRRLAAVLGGVAYLIAVLNLDPWLAAGISAIMALLLLILRLRFRRQIRGLSQDDTRRGWAEIAYPSAGALSLAVGWGLLNDRWLAFLPIAFMAWGDNAAGLARGAISSGREMSAWPSIAMLGVCLVAAALYQPYWIGAVGAAVATAAERFHVRAPLWDDNWVIVAASLSAMTTLTRSPGLTST